MPSAIFLSLALPLLASGNRWDIASGARAESSGGSIPVTSGTPSTLGLQHSLQLRSGLRRMSPRSTFTLAYLPSYYLRTPDELQVGRPLLLHQLTLAYTSALSRKVRMSASLQSSAGELPGSAVTAVFEPGTGAVTASVLPLLRLTGTWSMSAQVSKAQATTWTMSGSHSDSLEQGSTAFQRSENVSTSLSHAIRFSRRTTAGASSNFGYAASLGASDFALAGAQLFMNYLLSPAATLQLGAGVSYGWTLAGGRAFPLPSSNVAYSTSWATSGQVWALNLGGGTRGFFDPTTGTYRPQAVVDARVSTRIRQLWTLGLSLFGAVDMGSTNQLTATQPTQLGTTLPVTYQLTRTLAFEFGVRASVRGPTLDQFSRGTFQEQATAYAALDWGTGTGSSLGSWLR